MSRDAFDDFVKRHQLDAETTAELLGLVEKSVDALPRSLSPVSLAGSPTLADVFGETTEDTEVVPPTEADRYDDRGFIARGGMGEVRRAFDRKLQRVVAKKTLQPNRIDALSAARFQREAIVTAQLQHPAIVPIYDLGQQPDGTRFFTMREVSGDTLLQLIEQVHGASRERWSPSPGGWTLHRLVQALARVSEAVAYAHARGAVHRDLKPENVMVGDFGEVQLLDWGLVKVVGEGLREPDGAGDHTRWGSVTGTPAYMSPEQASGEIDRVGPPSDVYGLGALLYHVLTGAPPYKGSLPKVLMALLDGHLEAPSTRSRLPIPPELETLCLAAMAMNPSDRPTATGFLKQLESWLDGSPRRQLALERVAEARQAGPRARALAQRAHALDRKAEQLLGKLPAWAGEARKAPAWEIADDARHQAREARQLELRARRLLQQALAHDPDCAEAHRMLAAAWREDHRRAESESDADGVDRAEEELRSHLAALPVAEADDHRRYLQGDGELALATDPPGADARLYRYEERNRRLVAVADRDLGRTPLEVALPMGRYLVVLKRRDHHAVHYPVHIARCARWEAPPVHLPLRGTLGPDEIYVPGGWFLAGDARCETATRAARVWVDDVVIGRYPVTVAAWAAFLDDLVARGQETDALRHTPRRGVGGTPLMVRDTHGRFVPRPEGLLADPHRPVVGIDHDSALAWLAWEGARRGRPLRLPGELEWEKAARGVDGRLYPWGDRIDPTWARIRASSRTRPEPMPVDSYPVDVSPYGVRGMGGNVSDWCADVWRTAGPDVVGDRAQVPRTDPADPSPRTQRGGNWLSAPSESQAPGRQRAERDAASVAVGFRWARSLR